MSSVTIVLFLLSSDLFNGIKIIMAQDIMKNRDILKLDFRSTIYVRKSKQRTCLY